MMRVRILFIVLLTSLACHAWTGHAQEKSDSKVSVQDFLFDGGSLCFRIKAKVVGGNALLFVLHPDSHLRRRSSGEQSDLDPLFIVAKDETLDKRIFFGVRSKLATQLAKELTKDERNSVKTVLADEIAELLRGKRTVAVWGADAVEALGRDSSVSKVLRKKPRSEERSPGRKSDIETKTTNKRKAL